MSRQVYRGRGRPTGPSRLSESEQRQIERKRRQYKRNYNASYNAAHADDRRRQRHWRQLKAALIMLAIFAAAGSAVYLAVITFG